jgi:hypothetical protein
MRTSEGWDRIRIEAEGLGISVSQACRRVGIRPSRFKQYLSGCVVPDKRTVAKLDSFFSGVRDRREIFGL